MVCRDALRKSWGNKINGYSIFSSYPNHNNLGRDGKKRDFISSESTKEVSEK
jgi:hypothetical protein